MATSPSPNSAPSAAPPPPPRSSSTPLFPVPPPRSPFPATSPHHLLLSPSSPPPHSQANSPTINNDASMAPSDSPSTNSTPPSSSPPPAASAPPAASSPPPAASSPPPDSASPPPKNDAPPPVTARSPPPPLADPPKVSPPPPITPINSPPPPSQDPPAITPTTPTPTPSPNPPASSPPPQSSNPPTSPPPRSDPPQISPPPTDGPPQSSPPPSSQPPQTSTPPPSSPLQDSAPPPTNSTTPPSTFTPPPPLSPVSQPSPNSSATPLIPVSPPPSSLGLSPPSPTLLQIPPPSIQTHDSNPPSSIRTEVAVSIGIVLGFLLLGAIGIAAWCMSKRSKRVAGMPTSLSSSPHTDSSLLKTQRSPVDSRSASEYLYSPSEAGGMGNSRPWFTFEALVEATNGFSEENLLGEGGFGRVYKGHLPDGQEVAVKQLKIGGGQGEREFKAEVDIISRIHHRHLVSLAGYCISDSRRLLVYEYVSNNTLHYHLHGPDRPVMTWQTRVKIATGASRGIAYLHEDCLPRIIHRDIKSANILLDKNFEARVSDFGLAKLAEDANSHVTTRVMGTFGYMAPEYASSGKLTEKSDVFSFGVVLLELITGRKPVDTSQPLGEESLVEWARPKLSHALATEEFGELVDPRLEKNYPDSEMLRAIEAAAACVRHSVAKRPSMGQVVRAFESMISADLTNGMRVGESAIYNNSAEQSAEIRLFRRMAFGSQDYTMDTFSQGSWHS